MMYNDVDNDLPPFNDTIDGEEIFLFSNTKTSSTGASFLHDDDDDHLRHNHHHHHVVASSSSHHLPVDVDELLLNSNFLEQPSCDQTEDPLFWNCKDIHDDQLNEFLPHNHLGLGSNNNNNNASIINNCLGNSTTVPSLTNTNITNCINSTATSNHANLILTQPHSQSTLSQIQHPQSVIPIQHQQNVATLISQPPSISDQHLQIRLQHQAESTISQPIQTILSTNIQQGQHPATIAQIQQGFLPQQQIIQHVDQYQTKWITVVQADQYQTFNAIQQQPTQQHALQFFEKIPQTIIQNDAGSSSAAINAATSSTNSTVTTSTSQNPVGNVTTTPSHQITLHHPVSQISQQQQMTASASQTMQALASQHQEQPQRRKTIDSQNEVGTDKNRKQVESTDTMRKDAASAAKQNRPKEKQTRLDCPYCKRSFSKNFDLQQHMRCHTGEKPFQCIVCGRGFAQKSNVKKHMQAHKVWPEGPHNPSMPLSQASARSRNNSASSTISTPRDDECMQENEDVHIHDDNNNLNNGNNIGLSNDRTRNDGTDLFAENRYSCSYCQFNGRTYFELKSHLTQHKREKVFKCIVSSCGKTFSGSDLQGFLDHVTGHKDLIYHCHLCSSQFYSLDEFGEHQKIHSNAQMKRTPQSSSVSSNHQNVQNVNKPFNSSLRQQNQQVAPTSQLLQQQNHRQYNQNQAIPPTQQSNNQKSSSKILNNSRPKNNNQKYFRCSKCMNRYTTQTALEHHLSISSHNFPCTECNKVFMCERYLRRHLNTHTAVQHVCSFCDKHFKTAAYLKMHSVVHTGEKPFRCNQCEAAFNRRDKLNRHKLTHETIKKFKCPFRPHIGCTKEFNRPDKLKAHVLTHSGVRPHPCDSCSKTFSRLSRLREHKKLHHDNNKNVIKLETTDNHNDITSQ